MFDVFINLYVGNLVMVTGGRNLGRVIKLYKIVINSNQHIHVYIHNN